MFNHRFGLVLTLALALPACSTNSPSPNRAEAPPLTSTVLEEKLYDTPQKTNVTLAVQVLGDITKEGMTKLLNDLYSQTRQRSGFKYHTHPTNVLIFAFRSKEHFESAAGLWIARLTDDDATLGNTGPVKIDFDEDQLAQLNANPEDKPGLSEEKRKQIYKEIVACEDKAAKLAEQKYGLTERQIERTPKAKFSETIQKQNDYEELLRNKNKNELAIKYKLSRKQLDEISREGFEKRWVLPKP